MAKITAIVLAAGQGTRMQTDEPKQFLFLNGRPLICHSLEVFQKCKFVDDIILVTGEDYLNYCEKEIRQQYDFNKISSVVAGGAERYDSVYQGLLACAETDYVMIHDGARPFITQEILERAENGMLQEGACVVGMPSKDTVKITDDEGYVRDTPSRDHVWIIQTPQCFSYEVVRRAYDMLQDAGESGMTDDAMVVERMLGYPVRLVKGSYQNIKITTREDLSIASNLIDR